MEKLAAGGGRNFPSRIGCPEDFGVASPACSAPYCGNGTLAGGVRPTIFAAGNARRVVSELFTVAVIPRTVRRVRGQPDLDLAASLLIFRVWGRAAQQKRFTPEAEENA